MITKGTEEYKRAGEIANEIVKRSSYERWNANTMFKLYFELIGALLNNVIEKGGFAAQVAESVEKSMNPYGFKIANCSSKQAWIIACSIVENNINYNL